MVTLVIITMNLHLGLKKKQEKHIIRPYEKDVRLRIYKLEF